MARVGEPAKMDRVKCFPVNHVYGTGFTSGQNGCIE